MPRTKTDYRKIWIDHYGEIPKDADGRSYEIHHIDGNCHNNDITNLTCVTIAEHYDLHKDAGDHAACTYIAARMDNKPEDLFEIRSKATTEMNNQLVAQGKHWFQNSEWRKANHNAKNSERIENRTHNFVVNNPVHQRVSEGTHNWQLAKGTVPCVDKQGNYIRVPRDVFKQQSGPKESWEYVHNTSNEGKRRLSDRSI